MIIKAKTSLDSFNSDFVKVVVDTKKESFYFNDA